MHEQTSSLFSGSAPGWLGRLPGMGDFSHRRLPQSFREAWGRWLRSGIARMQISHPHWPDHYLDAPRWCFVLGNDVVDAQGWVGVLVPSVDEMGRRFPFTIATELGAAESELRGSALVRLRHWWELASRAAREGTRESLDAVRFEMLLHQLFAAVGTQADDAGAILALPEVGQSLWLTDPTAERGLGMAGQELPQDDQFDALFGCAAGAEASGSKER
ncbi:type VI secretion system-associated protein TagF [Variovorax sp. Sphag1AA]|uniref:type VI secretion system-associated protein TagF n=1 Tax=Variovorax sp. Sphag1AA TaxID=2587027 RepID=UPI00288A1A02|nr:type VI secretion system-associated protein TagF [Variovorax sp. Sphag1AA]